VRQVLMSLTDDGNNVSGTHVTLVLLPKKNFAVIHLGKLLDQKLQLLTVVCMPRKAKRKLQRRVCPGCLQKIRRWQ
jgi:hypothetical protein